MCVDIISLGSGSSGNSLLIKNRECGILIDAGFSKKMLLEKLAFVGVDPKIIKTLLITHEHSDHIKGARVIANTFDITTYASKNTLKYMLDNNKIGKKYVGFNVGASFELLDFHISTFQVTHDAIDPVGFVISINGIKIAYAMDLGYLDPVTIRKIRGCNVVILEANHDIGMLKNSNRPIYLKRRIVSKFGHLDNETVVNSFDSILTNDTKYLLLGHISDECNCYNMVYDLARKKLDAINRTDVNLYIMKQNLCSFLSVS